MTYTIPKARTNYGIFNIRFQGAKIWNDTNDDIKLLSLSNVLKKSLSQFLFVSTLKFFLAFCCLILARLAVFFH